MTKQRLAVLSAVRETGGHPTAGRIYNEVRRSLPRISLGTVYRNLSELRDAGLISEIRIGSGSSRFDCRTEPHHHVRCLKCGRIEDVNHTSDPRIEEAVSDATGYRVISYAVHFEGICAACAPSS